MAPIPNAENLLKKEISGTQDRGIMAKATQKASVFVEPLDNFVFEMKLNDASVATTTKKKRTLETLEEKRRHENQCSVKEEPEKITKNMPIANLHMQQ